MYGVRKLRVPDQEADQRTWKEVVQKDCHCQARKLNWEDATDCNRWRKQISDD